MLSDYWEKKLDWLKIFVFNFQRHILAHEKNLWKIVFKTLINIPCL